MPQEQITYRRATVEDLDRICEQGQEANRPHHEAWPQIFAPSSDPARDQAHWAQSLQSEAAATFVAEQADIVVGFVTVHIVDETKPLLQPMRFARVGSICVADSERGCGIGRALMMHAEDWASSSGATDVRLNVWEFNEGAVHLYAELGYQVRSLSMGKAIEPRRT